MVEAFDFFAMGCSSGSSADALRFEAVDLAGADRAGGETVDGFRDEVLVSFGGRMDLAGVFVFVDAGFAAAAAFFGGMLINVARRSVGIVKVKSRRIRRDVNLRSKNQKIDNKLCDPMNLKCGLR